MKTLTFAALSLAFVAPAYAGDATGGQQVVAAGGTAAVAGGKITAFDANKKILVIEANGVKTELSTASAMVAGQLAVGKEVDIVWANGLAVAISVRGDSGSTVVTTTNGLVGFGAVATAPGAIAGGKITAYDAAKKTMTVEANGQKTEISIANAAIAGQIAVGKIVDVTFSNGKASAVAVRP